MKAPPILPVADTVDPVQSSTLPNGMRLVVVERHGYPIVAARLLVDRGSFDLDDGGGVEVSQLQQFFARAGSEAAFERLADVDAASGVSWATGSNRDGEWVDAAGPTEAFDDLLGTLEEVAVAPHLDAREHDRVSAVVQRSADWKAVSLLSKVQAILFGEEAYGARSPTLPLTTDEAQALHDRLFQPSHAVLVVVGDVAAANVEAAVDHTFATWSSSASPLPRKESAPRAINGPRVAVVRQRNLTQTRAAIFARGPRGDSDDVEPLELAARLLGGDVSSPLFGRLREGSGAAYVVEASVSDMRAASVLSIYASFDSDKTVAGARDILRAIDDLRSGRATDEDIAIGRETLLARWRLDMSTAASTAATYARWIARGRDPARLADEPARIARLGRQDVEHAARLYLGDSTLHVLFMGEDRWLDVGPLQMGGAKVLANP